MFPHIVNQFHLSLIFQDEIQCVSVVIISPRHRPVERFVFEIAPPPTRSLRYFKIFVFI